MSNNAITLKWKEKQRDEAGFEFMWKEWKEHYLPNLFPDLDLTTDLYNNSEPVQLTQMNLSDDVTHYISDSGSVDSKTLSNDDLVPARIIFIKWLLVIPLCDVPLTSGRYGGRREQMQADHMEVLREEDGSLSGDLHDKDDTSSLAERQEEENRQTGSELCPFHIKLSYLVYGRRMDPCSDSEFELHNGKFFPFPSSLEKENIHLVLNQSPLEVLSNDSFPFMNNI